MSFLYRRLLGSLGAAQSVPWPGVSAGGSFQALGGYHGNMMGADPGVAPSLGVVSRTVTNVTWSGGSATVTTSIVHLLYTGMWVELSGILGATGANGNWKVATVPSSTTFTIVMADPGTWSAGGTQRMNLIVPKRLSAMTHFSVSLNPYRGLSEYVGSYAATNNNYVPYNLYSGIKLIESASSGAGSLIQITITGHPFSTNDVVEITGLKVTNYTEHGYTGRQIAQGVWTITKVDANNFTLNNSVYPTGLTNYASSGIVELHTNATARRAAVLSGGTDNPSATTPANYMQGDDYYRSYRQAATQLSDFLYSKTGWRPGYYFSSSCVGTPYQASERGNQGSYPMALVNLDKKYTNGWGISTSQTNAGNLQLTLTKTPPAWTSSSTIYAVIFNHSNPTHGFDRFLDKASAFSQLRGFRGACSSGTSTVLTHTGAGFTSIVLGTRLHITSGARAGQSSTVIAFTTDTITVSPAFSGALAANDTYIVGSYAHPISSVDSLNKTITLRVPYASADGTGGCVMFMGQLADSNCVTDSGVSNGAGGTYALLTMKDPHGLAAGDYVSVHNTIAPSAPANSKCVYNFKISNYYTLDPLPTRQTVFKVLSAPSTTTAVVDCTFSYTANRFDVNTNAWWFGSCLAIKSTVAGLLDASDWTTGTDRIDSPDYRRTDLRSLFVNDQKTMLDNAFAQAGVRNIGLFDENSIRYTSSAASTFTLNQGVLCGETAAECVNRLGLLGDYLRSRYGVKFAPNTTNWLTKDALSSTLAASIATRWGGICSEGHCYMWDRSYYQMVQGWLATIETILAAGGSYCYVPQSRSRSVIDLAGGTNSGSNGGYVKLLVSYAGLYPSGAETTSAGLGTPHNHSGHLIGVYGCTKAALNGVHRVRGLSDPNQDEIYTETRFVDAATHTNTAGNGHIVYSSEYAPMKVTGLSAGASSSVRVTTEFPHGIPPVDECDAIVEIHGYRTDATKDASGTPTSAATYRASITTHTGTADSGTATTLTKAGAAFADHLIGGWLVITGGTNSGQRRQITARTATQLTVGTAFSSAIDNTSVYKVYSASAFDLITEEGTPELTYDGVGTVAAASTIGICFHTGDGGAGGIGADEEFYYGICYMLWKPGRAIYFDRGLLNRHSSHQVTHENVHAWLPAGLTPDAAYSVVDYTGTADSGSTTTIVKSGASFQDCCLGEQVAIIGGAQSGQWSRITAINGGRDTLTVSPAFSGSIDNTSQYYVGKTVTGDTRKVLELKRTFDGATKTVQVFPQKTYVTYTGFTWDTDA